MSGGPLPASDRIEGMRLTAIGVDEVGRGAWCGPVMTGAACIPDSLEGDALRRIVRDSKTLSAARREVLDAKIRAVAHVALGAASAREIDALGIRPATLLAMRRAVLRLVSRLTGGQAGFRDGWRVVADGVDCIPGLLLPGPWTNESLVRGDALLPEISAASIVAKVARDRLMARLALRHPEFAWERNAGYGTAAHADGLRKVGPGAHHRRSFKMPGKTP